MKKSQSIGRLLYITVLLLASHQVHSLLIPACQLVHHCPRTSASSSSSVKINNPHQHSSTQLLTSASAVEQALKEDEYVDLYRASAWSFGWISALLLLMPDRTLSKQLAFKLGGSGGFGLAAFVFYVLSRSNQYEKGNEFLGFQKRCQLGLVGFCGLGLLSFPGEASFWPSALPAVVTSIIMIAVRIGGLVVALGGWLKDCTDLRWRKELQYGLSDNWRGLKVHDKKKSLFYRNCVFVIFFAILSNVMQAIFQYRYQDALELSSLTGSLHVSAVSRLLLVSSLLFSLKLASETETFPSDIKWQTNWALAAWAGLVGIGQCVSFHPSIQVTRNRIEMLTLSGLLFAKGLKVFRQSDATNERSGTFDDDSESDDTSQDDDIDDGEVGNGKDEV